MKSSSVGIIYIILFILTLLLVLKTNIIWNHDKKKEEIMGMLDKLHTPISVDDILLEMIVSETKGYFEGKQTSAEAAGQFENKAKLYYAE